MEKAIVIRGLFVLTALVLLAKIAQLQFFDPSARVSANAAAISAQVNYPSRGLIYDRHGRLMVYNDAMYDILLVYNNMDPAMDTTLFCSLLDITKETFLQNIDKNWRSPKYSKSVEFVFLSKVPVHIYARFQERLFEFPGFRGRLRNVRGYQEPMAAHVLGYINEVDQSFIDKSEGAYESGDFVGVTGLEQAYEKELRGEKGIQYILKDNIGREVGPFENGDRDVPAQSGLDLVTTLDLELQAYAEKLMKQKIGGIVAIEPATGEILCMHSSPSWDPQLLTIHKNRTKAFELLSQDSLNPFFDRTIQAQYPPGSIFKMVVALIAMQEETLRPNQYIPCDGVYRNARGDYRKCRNHPAPYNVATALQYSCNSYFFETFKNTIDQYGYNQAERGLDNFYNYLKNFGFGASLSFDHRNEETGNIPNSEYYRKNFGYNALRSSYIVSLGIGQGELQMTTLQMANLAAIMANRGFYVTPHLLKGFSGGEVSFSSDITKKRSVLIAEHHFNPVIQGMLSVVTSGTGRLAQIPKIEVCGKTGTVENPHGEDHSVFISFAPKEDPKIALAVYVENSGGGGSYAAPISGLLIEKYLQDSISPSKLPLEERMIHSNLLPGATVP